MQDQNRSIREGDPTSNFEEFIWEYDLSEEPYEHWDWSSKAKNRNMRFSFDYEGPHDRDSREAYDYWRDRKQIIRDRDIEEIAYLVNLACALSLEKCIDPFYFE